MKIGLFVKIREISQNNQTLFGETSNVVVTGAYSVNVCSGDGWCNEDDFNDKISPQRQKLLSVLYQIRIDKNNCAFSLPDRFRTSRTKATLEVKAGVQL